MNELDIFTLGSGYYLEKIFNAIKLILDGDKGSFLSVMKAVCMAAMVALGIKGSLSGNIKESAKWIGGILVLVGLLLTTRTTVYIHDTLPDSYGIVPAVRKVDNVPWGLAFIGHVTSTVGNSIAEKFDSAFAGVFVNKEYQQTGLLFGSKIVEDTARLRTLDTATTMNILKFYKKCIVKDVKMGHKRKNGYTIKDLTETDDILNLLRNHSSKARLIYFTGNVTKYKSEQSYLGSILKSEVEKVDDYISCNKAANYIADTLEHEMENRIPVMANSFMNFFAPNMPELESKSTDKNEAFKAVLQGSYGNFLRTSAKDAKDILLQNVMINALGDTVNAYNKAYERVSTEEMTKSAFVSASQMAQKFVPVLRAVLECLFYGVFPIILLLMLTPNGLEILKNYAYGFVYLQLWQPMYAILFCIAGAWGSMQANSIDGLSFASHMKISRLNEEISAMAGYMLLMTPVLSIFITKGMVSSMGNLANSILYIPQTSAVQQAQKGVEGNYSLGNTNLDNHSFGNTTGNKFDDNHSWMSGMRTFSMASGAHEKMFADGRIGLDSSSAINNMAGLAGIDWNKAIGSRFDKSINENMSLAERMSSQMVNSEASGYSKLLGYDQNFSQDSSVYRNWNSSLNSEQRSALDETRNTVKRFAENHGISQQDALKLVLGANFGKKIGFGSGSIALDGNTAATKDEAYNNALETVSDKRFSSTLGELKNISNAVTGQQGNSAAESMLYSSRSDFNQSHSANLERSRAIERVESLQESKSAYEQNSSSIRQELSHDFAEQNINKYGAAQFEDITRSKPHLTNQLLNEYLDNIVGRENQNIAAEFGSAKAEYDANSSMIINDSYQQNSMSIDSSYQDNLAKVKNKVPEGFEETVNSKLDESAQLKEEIEDKIVNSKDLLSEQAKELEFDARSLQEKAENKTKQSATGTLIKSWNPIKND